jgi:hypothetical protein
MTELIWKLQSEEDGLIALKIFDRHKALLLQGNSFLLHVTSFLLQGTSSVPSAALDDARCMMAELKEELF